MCMANIQYTIRNIPPPVDQVIRKRAAQSGVSLNQMVVELLILQTLEDSALAKVSTVDDFFGKAGELLDEEFDKAIASFSVVDQKWWDDPGHTRY